MTKTTFIVDSDLHFKYEIKPYKRDHVQKIIKTSENIDIDAIICPGDLTHNGWSGKKLLCWKYGGEYDQVTPLKEQFVDILEKRVAPVYLCDGNHDYYVPKPYIYHGVLEYIKEKHGSLCYSFDKGELHFICLSKYPNEKNLKFLKKDLSKNSNKNIIIYFHFNLTGQWSDWWSDNEKEALYETIKTYNIIALLVGHSHISTELKWKNYRVILAASEAFALCTFENNNLTVKYI